MGARRDNITGIDRLQLRLKYLLIQKPMAGLELMTMVEKHMRTTNALMRKQATRNPIEEIETFGEKAVDAVARFGGSWGFAAL